jgi:putative hemolysin
LESSLSVEPPVANLLSSVLLAYQNMNMPMAACIILIIILLLGCSAFVSSSENAFFSLNKSQLNEIENLGGRIARCTAHLLARPKYLLATILIVNTLANMAIVMLATVLLLAFWSVSEYYWLGFVCEIIVVTFVLVLFGEVMPKLYAAQNNVKVAKLAAYPLFLLSKLFAPFVFLLVKSSTIIDKRVTKKGHILSVDELTHAIDITNEEDTTKEEKVILKSIVNFGNITVRQIMRQRPDIAAIKSDLTFKQLLLKINDLGYSRMPVYTNNLDNVIGVLNVKDLLPHMHKGDDYNWLVLIRRAFFVPESKKIDDLLKEFQSKRTHLAIVVDEFGGTQGVVTMEDILEEIFGEIHDEFDEDEIFYSRLNDNTYVFEAKTLINDMCKFMDIDAEVFDEVRDEADTVAGMLLELSGEMPKQGDELSYKHFKFTIESADKRRIKRIKVEILHDKED